MRMRSILASVIVATALDVAAQQPRSGSQQNDSISQTKFALARELAVAAAIGSFADSVRRGALDTGQAQTRLVQQRAHIVADWNAKYLPPDTLIEFNARALAREFTESELRELTMFFKSPIGRRYAGAKASLVRRTSEDVNRVFALHGKELSANLDKTTKINPH